MKKQLLKYNDLCILLYQGNISGAQRLFQEAFSRQSNFSIKDLTFSLGALNLSIYYYILSNENVSLDALCLKHRKKIDQCPCHNDALYQLGLTIIQQYGYCKEYLIEKHTNEHIKKVLRHIHQHLGEPISLDDLASYVGLAKTYLAQLFKEKTSKTIQQYIMDERLKLATQLLKQNHLSIASISELCGFNSPGYFATSFKDKFHTSPKQYQKCIRDL